MNLRTYQAYTMAEALAQVKSDLGRDAVILNTRTFKRGGVLGMGGKQMVEITASADVQVLHPRAKKGRPTPAVNATSRQREAQHAYSQRAQPGSLPPDQLLSEIGLLKKMVTELVNDNKAANVELPPELVEFYTELIGNEVADEIVRKMLAELRSSLTSEQLADQPRVRAALLSSLAQMLPTCGPIALGHGDRARVVALIGPTGVGKTTTIAKLAANFKLRENKRVALITIDTYRIAAVDQLRTYANIINVPIEVVCTPVELSDAVLRHKNCDLILIDTAGRSPKDELRLNELRAFLDAASPDETHLVISSTANPSTMKIAAERFSALTPHGTGRVILTKLDEAVNFGMIIGVIGKLDASLSYVTTGQDVPDDIAVGEGQQLARLILGERATINCTSGTDQRGDGSGVKPEQKLRSATAGGMP